MDAARLLTRYRGALMGFAQLWIIVLHCWLLVIPGWPVLGAVEAFVKWNGSIGLEVFFFLSGIGLTHSIRKGSLGAYYAGRLRRVLLPYWVMALLTALTEGKGLGWLLAYATGVGPLFWDFQGLLWFIPAILILYMAYPAYHALMKRAGSKTAFTLAALLAWLCAVMVFGGAVREDFFVLIHRIPAFLVGVWLGEISRERQLVMRWEHWALCALAAAAGYLLRIAGSRGLVEMIPQFHYAATGVCSVPLCLLLAGLFSLMERGRLAALFRWPLRFLSFVGGFTLELYCCHQWLFYGIYTLLEGRVGYLTINLIGFPAVIAAGWLFHQAHMRVLRRLERR